jgi:hypothetical protein
MGGLDGATYLRDIQTAARTLGVAQHDEDAGLFDRCADLLHLRAVLAHGVRHVVVDECRVAQWGVCPDGPVMNQSIQHACSGSFSKVHSACSPWVAGDEHLRKAEHVGTVACSLLDQGDDLCDTAL